jgi:hypothetical protein
VRGAGPGGRGRGKRSRSCGALNHAENQTIDLLKAF